MAERKQYTFIQERKCWKCKKVKDRSEFQKDKHDKYGLQKGCRECINKRNEIYRRANADYFKQKSIEQNEKYLNRSDKKEYNQIRYLKHQDKNIKRTRNYRSRPSGRFLQLLESAKARSRKKKLLYELDIDWLLDIYEAQGKVCILTGFPFDFSYKEGKGQRYNPLSPSLHRLNSLKGYTKDNVVLVITGINIALNEWGNDFYEKVALAYFAKKQSKDETFCT